MDIGNIDNYFLKQQVAETPENGSLILDNYEEFSYKNKDSILPQSEAQAQYQSVLGDSNLKSSNRQNSFEKISSPLRQS